MNTIRTTYSIYLWQSTPRSFKFPRRNARKGQQGVEGICFDGGATGKQAEILTASCGGSCMDVMNYTVGKGNTWLHKTVVSINVFTETCHMIQS